MKAFLGIGLLGNGFVQAMLRHGLQVQVWNRTASRAKDLEQYGAKAFENILDAVHGADAIHICVKDDAAVDEVLAKAEKGFQKGTVIIDHSTTTVEGAIERTKKWKEKGFPYQHAPVLMGPQNALDSTGMMLVSGDQDLIKRLEPELSKMTGKLVNMGDKAGKAAAMKLTSNLFLIGLNGAVADTVAFGNSLGISTQELIQHFSQWNPAHSVVSRMKKMTDSSLPDPSWTLEMARKDAGLFLLEAKNQNIHLSVIPGIASVMDKKIKEGHSKEDWSVIGRMN